jgi:hypothetical protein
MALSRVLTACALLARIGYVLATGCADGQAQTPADTTTTTAATFVHSYAGTTSVSSCETAIASSGDVDCSSGPVTNGLYQTDGVNCYCYLLGPGDPIALDCTVFTCNVSRCFTICV